MNVILSKQKKITNITKEIIPKIVKDIQEKFTDRNYIIMEFCGTHTHEIARYGIRSLFPKNIDLRSGPGCPVCVTAEEDIDYIINLVLENDLGVITFGDLVNVPGSKASLSYLKASGKDVIVVYNPLDSINIAKNNLNKNYLLIGIGFETTVPLLAFTLIKAKEYNIKNLFYLSLHKLTPPTLDVLLNSKEVNLDGVIGPGHVSTIIGSKPWEKYAYKYKIPIVISGFEPEDIVFNIYFLLNKIKNGDYGVWNNYKSSVKDEGNLKAMELVNKVFKLSAANWRGFGIIENSGLELNEEYKDFDIRRKFVLSKPIKIKKTACRCGEVLRGVIKPYECPLFAKACTPSSPKGPCMVSSEGTCAAYYLYENNYFNN
ncbi:MAG: hydrogenase formation protein HypD [bacterium]